MNAKLVPLEPYEDWKSIYNDEIKTTWASERLELRKLSMIYCAFKNELEKLKCGINNEIEELRSELKRRDYLQKSKSFVGLAKSQYFDIDTDLNKENSVPESVPLQEIQMSEDIIVESPNASTFFNSRSSPPLLVNKIVPKKKNSYREIDHKIDKTPKSELKEEFKTPNICNDSNFMDSSIVEKTPDIKFLSKQTKINKLSLLHPVRRSKSKFNQSKQSTTLTQMFGFEKSPKKKKKRVIDTNGPSMGIDTMLNLINESSSSETEEDLDKTCDGLDNSPIKQEADLSSFVKNYDKIPEKKSNSPGYVYDEVVRGKERQKLKGWACAECEDYYKGLDLPPEEIEAKKNQCSRHRHKFQARAETFDGFWDLTFGPTPPTQGDKSLVFNYKKK